METTCVSYASEKELCPIYIRGKSNKAAYKQRGMSQIKVILPTLATFMLFFFYPQERGSLFTLKANN